MTGTCVYCQEEESLFAFNGEEVCLTCIDSLMEKEDIHIFEDEQRPEEI